MSDSQYFTPLNLVQIGSAITRDRFVFVDDNGLTTAPNGKTPLGIYYHTNNPITPCGYAQYYNLGQTIPVWLEIGSTVITGNFLGCDSIGRGVPNIPAYAIAQQSGNAGDYIRVIMGNYSIYGPFSKGFSLGFSGG